MKAVFLAIIVIATFCKYKYFLVYKRCPNLIPEIAAQCCSWPYSENWQIETQQFLPVVFAKNAMEKQNIFEWHKRLIKLDRSGQPKTAITDVNVTRVATCNTVRQTVKYIAKKFQCNPEAVKIISTVGLGMRKISVDLDE